MQTLWVMLTAGVGGCVLALLCMQTLYFIGDNFRQKLEIWSRNPATAQRQVE